MNKTRNTKSKWTKILVLILALITIATTSLCIYLLVFHQEPKPIIPDYMPIEQDEYVFTLPSEPDDAPMQVPDGGGGAIIICDTEITVHLDTGKVDMIYKNPQSSASVAVLQLRIGDTIIAQSGSIYPGYQLEDMYLLDSVLLQEGGYYGIMKIAFYDPQTSEKALIDTDIEVSITVVP